LLVSVPLSTAVIVLAGRAARGRKANIADLFLGYRRLGTLILWSVMVAGASCIVMIRGAAAVGGVIAMGGREAVWLGFVASMLIYAVIFLVLYARFGFVGPMLIDPDVPRRDLFTTVRLCWEATSEGALGLMGLLVVAGLVTMATVLILCVGV